MLILDLDRDIFSSKDCAERAFAHITSIVVAMKERGEEDVKDLVERLFKTQLGKNAKGKHQLKFHP